jgi:hypothetical protein
MSLVDDFKRTIASGLVDRTLNGCYRWATKRRVMGEPFPGAYSAKYHPWVKELHDSTASFNYAMKAAQIGVTEVGINLAFYVIDQLKRDVLYVLPTATIASDFSKARFGVALKLSRHLEELFTDTNTVNLKQAGTNNLYIRGSRGESNLVSIPVSTMVLDEVDRMDQKTIWLALERLSGQIKKAVWGISTPTIPNYGIHKLFLSGTQELFMFKCPSCSRRTELVWPDCIKIIGESVSDPRCHESFLKCKECKNKLNHADKPNWLGTGLWTPTATNVSGDVRSFNINQLYSFTVSPGEIVEAHFRGLGDDAAAQEFHNSKLGKPFLGEGSKVTDTHIKNVLGVHTMDTERPARGGERLITLGVDQGKWNYWNVSEWFVDKIANDVNVSAHCKVLAHGKFHEDDWYILRELMVEWQVLACVIDADPAINDARRFAKEFPGYVYLCRYRRGKVGKEMSISEADTGAPLVTVDRTNWLTATLGRFRTDRISLPADVSHEYKEHVKSLVRIYEKDEMGNPVAKFVETGPDHYAHSLVYSEIALPLAASISSGEDVERFL